MLASGPARCHGRIQTWPKLSPNETARTTASALARLTYELRQRETHMRHTNFHVRIIVCCVVLGTLSLLGACQQTGSQSSAGNPTPSSVQAPKSTEKVATSTPVVAYVPSAMPTKPLSSCNLEAVGTAKFGTQPMQLRFDDRKAFMGWIDASALAKPTYWLRFDNQSANRYVQMPVTLSVQRPDVASTHAGAPLVSGFDAYLPADSLPSGKYHVYLAAEAGGAAFICDNGRYVIVTR